MEMKELEARYGKLMIQKEIIENKIMEVKRQIITAMNELSNNLNKKAVKSDKLSKEEVGQVSYKKQD